MLEAWKFPDTFVKTAQFAPHRPADHEERSRRLLHRQTRGVVQRQTTVPPVHRITRPDSVKQYDFQNQGGGCGQLAHHETGLRASIGVHKPSAGARGAGKVAGLPQRFQAALEHGIRIQQQHIRRIQHRKPLIYLVPEVGIEPT